MSRAIIIPPTVPLGHVLALPGDKSLAHRRALLSLFVSNEVRLENYASGADAQTTLKCVACLGKTVTREGSAVNISGKATVRDAELNCENSATTARLLMGILAARAGTWMLTGDASLAQRPMERVAEPLRKMGAQIELTDGCLPARIVGRELRGIEYAARIASAQVKSAVILAAMQAHGITRYREPLPTRDHTERLLGVQADDDGWITVNPLRISLAAETLSARIPGDISAAMFWMAAALLVQESQLTFRGVLMNRRRERHVELLREAGAEIEISNLGLQGGEETADVTIRSSFVKALSVEGARAVAMIDEIPMLAVLAAHAKGTSVFTDVRELRVKEADRLQLTAMNLQQMGATVHETEDTLMVEGGNELHGAEITTKGDHRIALSFAVAGLAARGETVIDDAECVSISYPEFWTELEQMVPGTVRMES